MGMRATLFRSILALATGLCLMPATVRGQLLYPEDLRADLEFLRTSLHTTHPDPYRYRNRQEVDRLFDGISAQLREPMQQEDLLRLLRPVFHAVADARTHLEPSVELQTRYATTEPLIPLGIRMIAGSAYVFEETKGFRSLELGCRIVSVNGLPMDRIVNEIRDGLVADGNDTTSLDRMVERDFRVLYRRFIGAERVYDLEVEGVSGQRSQQRLFAMTGQEMERTRLVKGLQLKPWRLEEVQESNTIWLTISTMDRARLQAEGIQSERFLSSVADVLRRSTMPNLVIDVRGAGGVDLAVAEEVFSLIAEKPYRVVSGMSVRSANGTDAAAYMVPPPEFQVSLRPSLPPEQEGMLVLRPDDPRLRPVQPRSKAFTGTVYVISDGLTQEAGAAFVMMAKRTGRARIVGEGTGSNAHSFCGGRGSVVELPRSRAVLHLPSTRYVPEGSPSGPMDRGEQPHFRAVQQAWYLSKGRDGVRVSLLEMIRELE